jgi:hypothetical protein
MDWATIGLSVFLGAVVQTTIIVMLYNNYIIPHIIKGVKDELMVSIEGWVDTMTGTLSEKIAAEINENVLSLKRSIVGKRGNNTRLLSAAQSYLLDNLSDDRDDPNNEDIIMQAVATYSKPIVDAVLDKIWPKKAEQPAAAPDNSAAGWC